MVVCNFMFSTHDGFYNHKLTCSSFWINLPFGAVAAASIVFFLIIPKTVTPAQATLKEKLVQMDIPGVLIITAAVICYLLAVQWAGVLKRWGSPDVVGTLVGSGVLFLIFLANEWWQGERALLMPSILKDRTVASGCAFCFL